MSIVGRLIIIGLAVLLAGAIAFASLRTESLLDFWYQAEALAEQPWGLVALVDLYVGFAFITFIIVLTEGSLLAGLLWAAPIFVLGNIWTALWLLLRLPALTARLTRPPA